MKGFWTCQRVTGRVRCGAANPNRRRICESCGKKRPAKKRPAHMSALKLPYSYYVEINGGEHCGVCGRGPSSGRKLDRDHLHEGVGIPRGLLCHLCNRALKLFGDDPERLRSAAVYLERVNALRAVA